MFLYLIYCPEAHKQALPLFKHIRRDVRPGSKPHTTNGSGVCLAGPRSISSAHTSDYLYPFSKSARQRNNPTMLRVY